MEHLFSLQMDLMQEDFNLKLKQDKLELMYQFQFHYQCSHLLEIKNLLEEILTFMVKPQLVSILNKKP